MIRLKRPECPNPAALAGGDYRNEQNKQALLNATNQKCMYCESRITHIDYGDVEHFRPKEKYPDLEFAWQNLGIACARCNREFKRDKFDETIPFIDPFDEDPENHIVAIGDILKQKLGSERGELTIIDIDLNRGDLIEKRSAKMEELSVEIDRCMRASNPTIRDKALAALKEQCQADKEYASLARTIFALHEIV